MTEKVVRTSEAVFCALLVAAVVTLGLAFVTPCVVDWLYFSSIWTAGSVFLFQIVVVAAISKIPKLMSRARGLAPFRRYAELFAPSIFVNVPVAYFLLRKTEWGASATKAFLIAVLLMACIIALALVAGCAQTVMERSRAVSWWTVWMGIVVFAVVAVRSTGILLPKPEESSHPIPTVALVIADTLRADVVSSCEGKNSAKVPNYFSFAKSGIECRRVFAASSWTPPESVSIRDARSIR